MLVITPEPRAGVNMLLPSVPAQPAVSSRPAGSVVLGDTFCVLWGQKM